MLCGLASVKTTSLREIEEWRWFLTRIRPAKFSYPNTFKPSTGRLTTLNWTKVMPTQCMQTGENPPYKGGWLEIGWARSGVMNQNIPNPGLTLRWFHPPHPYPLNGVKGLSPNANLRTRVVLNTQVWQSTRVRDGRSHLLLKALCLIPEQSAGQRLWEGLGKRKDSRY